MCAGGTEQHPTTNRSCLHEGTAKVKNVWKVFVGLCSRVEKKVKGKEENLKSY